MVEKNKIKLIDNLLEDDNKLESYISNIENKNINTPCNLNREIYRIIEESNNKNKIKNSKVFGILQIAACTVFALIVWKFVLVSPNVDSTYCDKKKSYSAKENINGVVNNFSSILMKPSDLKGGEK